MTNMFVSMPLLKRLGLATLGAALLAPLPIVVDQAIRSNFGLPGGDFPAGSVRFLLNWFVVAICVGGGLAVLLTGLLTVVLGTALNRLRSRRLQVVLETASLAMLGGAAALGLAQIWPTLEVRILYPACWVVGAVALNLLLQLVPQPSVRPTSKHAG